MDTNWEEPCDDDKLLFRGGSIPNRGLRHRGSQCAWSRPNRKAVRKRLGRGVGLRNIPFRQQPAFDVLYKGQKVGLFIPDLIAFDAIVVDTKVIAQITDHERGLMLNYLRITKLRIGVILNFKHRKLEWQRIAL
jgi:GxxExxY protein